jgi:hypothetical protein
MRAQVQGGVCCDGGGGQARGRDGARRQDGDTHLQS